MDWMYEKYLRNIELEKVEAMYYAPSLDFDYEMRRGSSSSFACGMMGGSSSNLTDRMIDGLGSDFACGMVGVPSSYFARGLRYEPREYPLRPKGKHQFVSLGRFKHYSNESQET